jgi:hypothetical protein
MTKKIYIIIILITIVGLSYYLATEFYDIFRIKEGVVSSVANQGTSNPSPSTRYNADNLNITYHEDPEKLDDRDSSTGVAYVFDKTGKKIALPPIGLGTTTTYDPPRKYKYGEATYVPKYEDSVYLSRTANIKVENKVDTTSSVKGGICNYYKNNMNDLETACLHTDHNVCASTSCCVLLGGSKCVSGTETGPTMRSHFNDSKIQNRDFYYYQGKCYGNCNRS